MQHRLEPTKQGLWVSSPGANAHGHQAAVHTWISTLGETTGLDRDESRAHAWFEMVRLDG
jgi:hypothetical protein